MDATIDRKPLTRKQRRRLHRECIKVQRRPTTSLHDTQRELREKLDSPDQPMTLGQFKAARKYAAVMLERFGMVLGTTDELRQFLMMHRVRLTPINKGMPMTAEEFQGAWAWWGKLEHPQRRHLLMQTIGRGR